MRLSSSLLFAVGLALSLSAASSVQAHEVVLTQVEHTQATIITLSYDDGEPFGGARFEAKPVGAEKPALTGMTDRWGRVVLFGKATGRWQLYAFLDDGHEIRIEFDRGASSDTDAKS